MNNHAQAVLKIDMTIIARMAVGVEAVNLCAWLQSEIQC